MLTFLRRGGFIQFVMAAIVILIIAAFAFDYRTGQASVEQACVVDMDGDCVPPKDFFSAFRLAVPPGMEAQQIKQQGLRKQVIDGLVERELLLREARKLGIGVSDEELDLELAAGRAHYSMPVEQNAVRMGRSFQLEPNDMVAYLPVRSSKTQGFDFKIYKRSVMTYARMSTKDFKEKQREELVAARMRTLIASQVRVAETEAFAQFSREGSKAIARIAHLPREWFSRFLVFPSAQQVDEFVGSHAAEIDAAWEDSKVAYVEGCADFSEIALGFDSEVEGERDAAKKKLDEARAQIGTAEDFAMAARVLSTRPSAQYGGRVGCLPTADDPESQQVQETLEGLAPGKLSQVIVGSDSVRLLRLNARLSATDAVDAGKRITALRLTSDQLAQTQTEQVANQILELAKGGTALDQAVSNKVTALLDASTAPQRDRTRLKEAAEATLERPRVEISSSFTIAGNPLPDALMGSVAPQLFALEKVDDLHPVAVPTQGGFALLQLKEKTPATREDFEARKQEIMRELLIRKQADALVSYVRRLRDEMQSKIQIDARFLSDEQGSKEDG